MIGQDDVSNSGSRNFTQWTRRRFVAGLPVAAGIGWTGSRGATEGAPMRAAVIGHTGRGDYGHGLDGIFANRPGIEICSVADPDDEGRKRTAAKIDALRHYATVAELLEREQPQLVSVAMRHADQHHAIVLAALRAGAHVYCEKPFVTSLVESDELLREARERKLRVAVAHTMRMTAPVVRLKHALAEGLIGDLRELRAFGKQDSRAGGEDMMVLGTHLFDLMRMMAGDPLWCHARVLQDGRDITVADRRKVKDAVGSVAGDSVFAQFAFGNGVNATFTSTAGLRDTTGHWGIEFFGSRGAARLNCDIAPNVFIRANPPWTAAGRDQSWLPYAAEAAGKPAPPGSDPVADWLEAIAEKREPECSGENGARAVEMVMAVYASALSGHRTGLPLEDRRHPLDS